MTRGKESILNPFVILLVDDDIQALGLLRVLLGRFSKYVESPAVPFEIVTALSGKETMQLIANGLRPNLVVSDLMMPDTDGIELIKMLKQELEPQQHAFHSMLVSAADCPDIALRTKAGYERFLKKPFTPQGICTAIMELCPEIRQAA